MNEIKTIVIERNHNPLQDLINISELCEFGCEALASNVTVVTSIRDGLAEPAVKGALYRTSTKNGVNLCRGVWYSYSIRSQQTASYSPGIGIPFGGTIVIAVIPGKLEIKVNYEPYVEPPTVTEPYSTTPPESINVHPSETPPEASPQTQYTTEIVAETQEEWIEKQIIKGGINRRVRNLYSINTLGEGEDLAPEEIVNDLIPDNDTADRIGKLAIIQSEENKSVRAFSAINFDLDLQTLIEAEASFHGLEFKEMIENQSISTYPSNSFSDSFSIEFFGRGD